MRKFFFVGRSGRIGLQINPIISSGFATFEGDYA
jgi:hypothetical protein